MTSATNRNLASPPIPYKWIPSKDIKDWHKRVPPMIVSAFLDERLFCVCASSESARRTLIHSLITKLIALRWDDSYTLVDTSTPEPHAVIGHGIKYYQDGFEDFGMWKIISTGLWKLPLECGWDVSSRLTKLDKVTSATMTDIMKKYEELKDGRYNALDWICISPEYQGKGIGTRAFKQLLTLSGKKGVPTTLITGREMNVTFYERLGFKVLEKVVWNLPFESQDGDDTLTGWMMKKEVSKDDSGVAGVLI